MTVGTSNLVIFVIAIILVVGIAEMKRKRGNN